MVHLAQAWHGSCKQAANATTYANMPWYRTFPIKVGNALIDLHRFFRIKVGSALSSNFRSETLFDVLDNESVFKT